MISVQLPDEAWGDAEPDAEALLSRWLVPAGAYVRAGQPIVEVVMLKATIEIEAPTGGVLDQILVPEGETFGRGRDLAMIDETAVAVAPSPAASQVAAAPLAGPQPVAAAALAPERALSATPAARGLARQEGIDLAAIAGSGPGGRVTETDVRQYLQRRTQPPAASGLTVRERIPFTGMRGAIAARLKAGWQVTPRVTETDEADMTACLALREQRAAEWEGQAGVRVTLNDLILRAVALTLREHPRLNATVADEAVLVHEEVNLGIAVNLDDGLIVPVIRAADRLSVPEIARHRQALVDAARAGTVDPSALQHGTFTVTNLGAEGPAWFTPVINPPQCAILGVGSIKPRPVVHDGEVAIRTTAQCSLVFDHRAVDGFPASRFLRSLIRRLEQPADL